MRWTPGSSPGVTEVGVARPSQSRMKHAPESHASIVLPDRLSSVSDRPSLFAGRARQITAIASLLGFLLGFLRLAHIGMAIDRHGLFAQRVEIFDCLLVGHVFGHVV